MTLGSRKSLQRAAITALIGAALVVAAFGSLVAANGTHSQSTQKTFNVSSSAISARYVGTVNVSSLPTSKAVGGRSIPLMSVKTPAQQAAYQRYMYAHPELLPAARGVPAPSHGANFVGTSAIPLLYKSAKGLSFTDSGCNCTPPDQAIGASNAYILEGVNNVFSVYNVNLAHVAGPFQAGAFFGAASGNFMSDPQITYDAERAIWIIQWLEVTQGSGTINDSIDFAFSTSNNPLGSYHVYKYAITSTEFCDYPTLGYEYWDIWQTCVEFSNTGSFLGNRTLTWDINTGIAGGSLGGYIYGNIAVAGNGTPVAAYRLSPATEDGVPAAEYVNASDAGYGITSTDMTTCAFTNTHYVSTGVAPTPSCVGTAMALAYDDPVNAGQPGNPSSVYPGFGWKQIRYQGGHLYFAMPILLGGCSASPEDGILWQAVTPELNNYTGSPRTISTVANYEAGYWCFGGQVDSYLPTLIPSAEGDIALVYNFSGASNFPSIGYTGRQEADLTTNQFLGQNGSNAIVVNGTAVNTTGRFGDYSACALTINSVARGIVFCAGEYGGTDVWNTWNYALRMQ